MAQQFLGINDGAGLVTDIVLNADQKSRKNAYYYSVLAARRACAFAAAGKSNTNAMRLQSHTCNGRQLAAQFAQYGDIDVCEFSA